MPATSGISDGFRLSKPTHTRS